MKPNILLKTFICAVLCFAVWGGYSCYAADKPIELSQLPEEAQTFISTYFADRQVALVTKDKGWFHTEYDVTFSTGEKVEFDGQGNWMMVKSRQPGVPADLIPAPITKYVSDVMGGSPIVELEKKKKGEFDVKLKDGTEIEFDKYYRVIDIDD